MVEGSNNSRGRLMGAETGAVPKVRPSGQKVESSGTAEALVHEGKDKCFGIVTLASHLQVFHAFTDKLILTNMLLIHAPCSSWRALILLTHDFVLNIRIHWCLNGKMKNRVFSTLLFLPLYDGMNERIIILTTLLHILGHFFLFHRPLN